MIDNSIANFPTIATVVPSFNRPRMLREALLSLSEFDQIVIADDGSDFDPVEVVGDLGIEATIVRNSPMSGAQRVRTPRIGALFNRALDAVRCHAVNYLCDDDMAAPGWYYAAKSYLRNHPETHIVRGDWRILGDRNQRSAFPEGFGWCLTGGNFIHLMSCYRDEHVRWSEASLAVQDGPFLTGFLRVHGMAEGGFDVPHVGAMAGWRREHAGNLIRFTVGLGYAEGAAEILDRGSMELDSYEVTA